jgi:hypothetical protein
MLQKCIVKVVDLPFPILSSVNPEIETMISEEVFGIRNKRRASVGTVPDKRDQAHLYNERAKQQL